MSLTLEQQAAAHAPCCAAVTAGAGTGKTHMLTERYLFHLTRQGLSPLQIVAVTFTEKAAAELRARIRRHVTEQLPDQPDTLARLEAAPISTLHALAARICREHPEPASVPPDFQIMDELEGRIWAQEQLLEVVSELPPEPFQTLPYSLALRLFRATLQDPIGTQKALAQSPDDILGRIQTARDDERREIVSQPVWQNAFEIIRSLCGSESDFQEQQRRDVLAAMTAFEANHDPAAQLNILDGTSFKKGSKKNWPDGDLEQCKAAMMGLRDWLRERQKTSLLQREFSPADERLFECLPLMRDLCGKIRQQLEIRKRRERILDFADLEVHALQALRETSVRDHYRRRWKAFLVDEFQDTNPVQAELIETLCEGAILTVVGDAKQSIYGFRGADASVFEAFQQKIERRDGTLVTLSQSFRTHAALAQNLNPVCGPLLESLHQPLTAQRPAPYTGPSIRAFCIRSQEGVRKEFRQTAEARLLVRLMQEMLGQMQIHDKETDTLRLLEPRDIAVLSRTWEPLDTYGDTLCACGIPTLHAGGGSLLETREGQDALAWIEFLADPRADLPLAALLRSPFFAVSDPVLLAFVEANETLLRENGAWWTALSQSRFPELQDARQVLSELLLQSHRLPPSRLLRLADRLTGYSAVVGNLPGADRRLADWRGLLQWIRSLESGTEDVFTLSRRLQRIRQAELKVPRPSLPSGNAVSLMTVHAAKGLEWPVVIVPDLDRGLSNKSDPVLWDPEIGLALQWTDGEDEEQTPILHTLLKKNKIGREEAEARRLLYVAMTRARDHLILTASEEEGPYLDLLRPGLEQAEIAFTFVEYEEQDSLPVIPLLPEAPAASGSPLLGSMGTGLMELPVTALSEYADCPRRFELHFVHDHPGLLDGGGRAARIGSLTHLALEHDIDDPAVLARLFDGADEEDSRQALDLARVFRTSPEFEPCRGPGEEREKRICRTVGGLRFNGIIDRVGTDWVLDYKTDSHIDPDHHRFQLGLYARETGSRQAYIAYLRHNRLHTFTSADLETVYEEMDRLVERIERQDFSPTPSATACRYCPYARAEICRHFHPLLTPDS